MTQLITPTLMKRLSRFSLSTKQSIIGGHKGEHRSRKHGSSLEFSDFRVYNIGDDLRQIDWNTYARTNKYYIKRFTDEKELLVTLFLDTTKSMFISEEKWKMVQQLAASITFMTLNHNDKFRLLSVPNQKPMNRSFFKGKALIRKTFHELEEIKMDESATTFATTLQKMSKTANLLQGVSIVISDFMEPVEPLLESLKQLQARKQQILLIQVLLSEEKSPSLTGDLKLVDIEVDTTKDVSMSRSVLELYDQKFIEHQQKIQNFARKRGMGFVSCLANEPVEQIVLNKLTGTGFLNVR
jgi:uncharacterized protein (DUF58 family)